MMKCREYIFLLTSGQLEQAGKMMRAEAFMHKSMCRRCRSFSKNNNRLDKLLDESREELTRPADGLEPGLNSDPDSDPDKS